MENTLEKMKLEFMETYELDILKDIMNLEENEILKDVYHYYIKAAKQLSDNENKSYESSIEGFNKVRYLIEDRLKDKKDEEFINFLLRDTIYCLDYIYSNTKEFNKIINSYNFREKTLEEILEYIDSLNNEAINLSKKAYAYLYIGQRESAKEIYLDLEKRKELTEGNLFNLARIYEEENNHEIADTYYDKILKSNPQNEEALRSKAYNLEKIDARKSLEIYNEIIKNNPKGVVGTYINRGRVYYYILGDKNKGLEDFDKAVSLDSNNYMAYYHRGLAYLESGKNYYAVEDFTKSISIYPYYVYSYMKKAEALILIDAINKYDEILENLDEAEKLMLSNDIYLLRASLYEKNKKYDLAEEQYKLSIEKFKHKGSYILLSKLYEKQNKKAEVKKLMQSSGYFDENSLIDNVYINKENLEEVTAFNRNDRDVEDLQEFQKHLYNTGNLEEAMELYKKRLGNTSEEYIVYYNMGVISQKQNNIDEAEEYYLKSISLKKDYTLAKNNLGLIYIDKGQYKKAIKLYEKLIKKYKKEYNPLANIWSAYFNLKEYKKALKYINKYIEAVPDKEAYLNRAKTHFKLGNYKSAIEDCEIAINANIDLPSSYLIIATSYYNLGEYKNANKYYRNIVELRDVSEEIINTAKQKIEETETYLSKNIGKNPAYTNTKVNNVYKYTIGYLGRGIYVGTLLGLILRSKYDPSMSTKIIISSMIVSAILGAIIGRIKDRMCINKMLIILKIEKDPIKNQYEILAINKNNIQVEYTIPADTMKKGRFKEGDRIVEINNGIYTLELK